jgi:hypothetical protein
MKRRTRLSDARVPVMHASAIVVSGATTGDRSAGANSASAATHFAARSAPTSACGVSAAKTATTTEYAFVTSCPASVNQGDRCDAD